MGDKSYSHIFQYEKCIGYRVSTDCFSVFFIWGVDANLTRFLKSRWLSFIDEIDEKSLKNSSKLKALLLMSSRIFDFDRKEFGVVVIPQMLDLSNCIVGVMQS